MRLRFIFAVCVIVGVGAVVNGQTWFSPWPVPATEPFNPAMAAALKRAAEGAADQIKWMGNDFLYDRAGGYGPGDVPAKKWAQLCDPGPEIMPADEYRKRNWGLKVSLGTCIWTADEIRPLLKHPNPKVRTLGIMLLYTLNRVDVLPDFAELAFDDAESFPEPESMAGSGDEIASPDFKWPMEERKVKFYARDVIRAYSEYLLPEVEPENEEGAKAQALELRKRLIEYSQKRDPTTCTPALRVAMRRATQGMTPLQDERRRRVEAVLQMAETLPMPRRLFVSLLLIREVDGLPDEMGGLFPGSVLDLARQVPREIRLDAFRGGGSIGDPDLTASYGQGYFEWHVEELFRESDASFFLKLEAERRLHLAPNDEGNYLTEFAVLAARLRPVDADAILGAAMDQIHGNQSAGDWRNNVATAMAEFGGEQSIKRSLDWFFGYRPEPGSYGNGREGWLEEIGRYNSARARMIYERIIRDPRLDQLGPYSTRILINAAGGYLGRSLATEEELRDSYSSDEAQRDRKFVSLTRWQDQLRSTVNEWSR